MVAVATASAWVAVGVGHTSSLSLRETTAVDAKGEAPSEDAFGAPNVQTAAPVAAKPEPLMVRAVSPRTEPLAGETELTCGAGYSWNPTLDPEAPVHQLLPPSMLMLTWSTPPVATGGE